MLLSITIVIIVNIVVHKSLTVVEDKLTISVELYDTLTQDQTEAFIAELKGQEIIQNIEFTSKNQALLDFKKRFKDQEKLITFVDSLESNPLYPSLTLTTDKSENYEALKAYLEKDAFNEIIREIQNQKDQSERIETFQNFKSSVQKMGWGLAILFGFISILTIYNTIKIAIHHRKREITIMQLVGSSHFHIILPFIVEGILYGLISLAVTLGVLALISFQLHTSSLPFIRTLETFMTGFYQNQKIGIFLIQLISAVSLGAVSSYAAIYAHMKRKRN